MNALKVIAVLLIAAGLFGVVRGGFSYVTQTHKAEIGSMHFSVDEKQRIDFPLWASIGAIVAGTVLLVTARKP
ncbi:hypothetical protein [Lacisediminimonas sp.]|uniref:hypothetical protein n=1 Tax=Lacisediminimonas sp. TaxID=3060582 RepID=UPI00271B7BAF|nr:hypothetical protein [Lacisediminimonas sp.]MDO8300115.1 hypothetical protein [Lacisediminimonas sp.]MDO9218225.1 hypothetical protein [Lacisediminimonas sp.]